PARPPAIRSNCACSPATTTATTSSQASSASTSPGTRSTCRSDARVATHCRSGACAATREKLAAMAAPTVAAPTPLLQEAVVGVEEALVAEDVVPAAERQRRAEHRAVPGAGVELAVLAAGIHVRRQLAQQRLVEGAPGEAAVEPGGVHAAQRGAQAAGDHVPRQRPGVVAEQREHRRPAEAGAQRGAPQADVLEGEVAEGDVPDPGPAHAGPRQRAGEGARV